MLTSALGTKLGEMSVSSWGLGSASPLSPLVPSPSVSCLIPVQYSIRWHDRKKSTRRPAITENVTTMSRGGLPEVLNNAVQTMVVNTTNRNGIHLYVTSRMTSRERMTFPMWSISERVVQDASTEYGWLDIEFRDQAFCSRLPSRHAFYLSPGGSSTTELFLLFHVGVR